MTDSSPITPPPELVQQWRRSGPADAAANNAYEHHIATRAAQWGADQELEACEVVIENYVDTETAELLRNVRRPEPPSLKQQALNDLNAAYDASKIDVATYCNIRRALEALPD